MNLIKILIVEDEVLIADYTKDILENNGFGNIALAHSVTEAQEKMQDWEPDIILMDINLEGNFEGVEFSRNKNKDAQIIFITGQTDSKTVEDALSISPESSLTKPIREVDLMTAVRIIINKKQKQFLFVRDGYDDIKIRLEDIIYIQADKNYLDIVTNTSKHTIRNTLQDFCRQLPSSFKQIHRSVFVNSDLVEKISTDEVLVKGFKLPLSRNYRQNL